ncbi:MULTISPECIES: extensin family protein [Mesorhizobium]|uniref:Extensin family protein n=1 Tax=Mesorhizobium denitrificans TaxID=2294114 RepID=A0A371XES9_9HYPH|nr:MULTISPECIES: extensin family protein [Mesorhizobium]RFC67534.1 extensin family protein [Mesorhizobium denitrificans]
MKAGAPLALLALIAAAGPALAVDLPNKVAKPPERPPVEAPAPEKPPLPTPSPEPPSTETQPAPEIAPVPAEKPAEANAPLPEPRPTPPASENPVDPADLLRQPPPDLGGPKAETAMPADEQACRAELSALGAKFKELPPVQEPAGCSMPHPLVVTQLTTEIDIAPEITVNCATALAAAKFSESVMSPAAEKILGSRIKSISQASGYVCRPRNGTNKLSEHAFGNAIDIAAFTLADKKTIAVEPAPPPENEKFLREVRNDACGPFKTVLGPGSDADHSLHFHLDLAHRRNGGTFCE